MTNPHLTSLLLGQSGGGYVTPYLLIIPLSLFGLLAFGAIVVILSLKQMKRSRELLHSERMKSFESGVPWQEPNAETAEKKLMHNAFWIAFWMVVVGCAGPFSAAASFGGELESLDTRIAIAAWVSAAAAGIAAVTCATVLVVKSRPAPKTDDQQQLRSPLKGKPV